jgi:hypothetical protein
MPNIGIFTTAVLPLELFFNELPLGRATGFLWRSPQTRQYFIITNWHVVTAKDFFRMTNINKTAARPNRILTRFQIPGQFEKQPWEIPIRDPDDNPLWLVHPGSRYDIVAIPFDPTSQQPLNIGLYPINEIASG